MSELTGHIHSYETFGAADGPGVRFVVFLRGCPWRCRYCHNPDTWAGAAGFDATVDEVLARALRYRAYWGDEGGITVSGGEPLVQTAFVAELFAAAHRAGVSTCLDTSGSLFDEADADQSRLWDETDTVLLDLKHIDGERHRELTRFDNAPALACARFLARRQIPVWIRHVLVPGWTDDEPSLRRLAEFIATLHNVRRVDVLPYHTFGVEKYHKLGLEYSLAGTPEPTEETVARARAILSPAIGGGVDDSAEDFK